MFRAITMLAPILSATIDAQHLNPQQNTAELKKKTIRFVDEVKADPTPATSECDSDLEKDRFDDFVQLETTSSETTLVIVQDLTTQDETTSSETTLVIVQDLATQDETTSSETTSSESALVIVQDLATSNPNPNHLGHNSATASSPDNPGDNSNLQSCTDTPSSRILSNNFDATLTIVKHRPAPKPPPGKPPPRPERKLTVKPKATATKLTLARHTFYHTAHNIR